MDLSNYIVSVLRTVVPAAWGWLLAIFAAQGLDPVIVEDLQPAANLILVPLVIGLYYAAVRAAEPRLPAFLRRLLLGSAIPPDYGGAHSTGSVTVDDLVERHGPERTVG